MSDDEAVDAAVAYIAAHFAAKDAEPKDRLDRQVRLDSAWHDLLVTTGWHDRAGCDCESVR